MQKFPMTPVGHKKIKVELDDLIKVQRPQNVKDIAVARAHGDLSENAEYHAAKEKQSFLEGRIQLLSSMIALAEVIDPSKIKSDKVAFGATVTLLDVETDDEKTYFIVGPEEMDVKAGMISIHSPIAKSLIGKKEGDTVIVKVPAKTIEYEVLEIKFV